MKPSLKRQFPRMDTQARVEQPLPRPTDQPPADQPPADQPLTDQPPAEQAAAPRDSGEPLRGGRLVKHLGLWTVLKEDLATHNGDWKKPGFLALAAYRLETWRRETKSRTLRMVAKGPSLLGNLTARNVFGIELYPSTQIGRRLLIGHQHGIVVHQFATIGDDCVVRQGVTMGVGNVWEQGKGPTIGDRVSFGVGCVLVGNIHVGDDASIAPNCVVTSNVPEKTAVFTPPARMLPREMK